MQVSRKPIGLRRRQPANLRGAFSGVIAAGKDDTRCVTAHPMSQASRERRRRLGQLQLSEINAQIARGEFWSVFIDDTGPAGNPSPNWSLPRDRRSYVAAVLPPHAGITVSHRLSEMLLALQQQIGVVEFHFTDMLNGKGRYRELDLTTRLGYFDAVASLVDELQLTFIVQSLGIEDARQWLEALDLNYKPLERAFHLTKPSDLALFILILLVSRYLDQHMSAEERAAVIVDEGWKKKGTAVWLGPLEHQFLHGLIFSASSSAAIGLQLADFGAFMLNRAQYVLGKAQLSELDKKILDIWSRLGRRFLGVQDRVLVVAEGDGGGLRLLPRE